MEYNVYLAMDLSTVFITFTTKGLSPFWVRTVRYRILDREGAKMTMEMIFLSNISKSTYMYLKSIKNIYYLQKQSIKYTKSSSLDFTTYKCSGEIRACFFVVSCFVERKRPLSLCKSRITFLCCSANKGFKKKIKLNSAIKFRNIYFFSPLFRRKCPLAHLGVSHVITN